MRYLILLAFFILGSISSYGQKRDWILKGGNTYLSNQTPLVVRSVLADSKGDIIIGGFASANSFLSAYKFEQAQNLDKLHRYSFIAKLSGKTGEVLWVRKVYTKNTGGEWQEMQIILDKKDNAHFLYKTPSYDTTIIEGAQNITKINPLQYHMNIFVEYSTQGDLIKVTEIPKFTKYINTINGFQIDENGSYIYASVIQRYDTTNILGFRQIKNGANNLFFLAGKDSLGKPKVLIYDSSINTCFGLGCTTIKINSRGNLYVLNHDPYKLGIYVFNKHLQLTDSKYFDLTSDRNFIKPNHMELDLKGNIYLAGTMWGNSKFAGKSYSKSASVPFICKLDSNLNEEWLLESNEEGNSWDLSYTNGSENIFLTGAFKKEASFDNKKIGNGTDENKLFAAKFNTAGKVDWLAAMENLHFYYFSHYYQLLSVEDICGNFYISISPIADKETFDGIKFDKSNDNSKYFGVSIVLAKYVTDTTQYVNFSANTYCDTVLLQSNYPQEYNKFYWLHNGNIIDSNKKALKYSFPKSGKYPITVLGIKDNGCQHANTDTVIFFKQPEAKFTHKDTAGCQWLGYQFINQSVADTIHTKNGESYLWDFGDGTTDTAKNPLHIFTKSGNFKVSLIYSNGFCTDTFTQEQTVEILAAPKPGFIVNDTVGCAPFTVNVKDNSQGAVVKYSYSFGKEYESNVANSKYTFTKPGIYYITQKLLGTTGCITTDSVRIRIRAGILPDENPEMLRATFIDNNQIEISWKKHPLAKHYNLYKQYDKNDFVLIQKHFPDTIYMDQTVSLAKPFRYYIQATDSCDNLSAQSLIAQPVILQGENKDNTIFLLNLYVLRKMAERRKGICFAIPACRR